MGTPFIAILVVLACIVVGVLVVAGRSPEGVTRHLFVVLGVLLACGPAAMIVTLALLPMWRWIEATFAIESVGHSGPAEWCYLGTYVTCVAILSGVYITMVRRR